MICPSYGHEPIENPPKAQAGNMRRFSVFGEKIKKTLSWAFLGSHGNKKLVCPGVLGAQQYSIRTL
jgi:hypothetical protein